MIGEQQNIELVYLRTECLAVTIKGVPFQSSLHSTSERESSLRISCEDDFDCQLSDESALCSKQKIGDGAIAEYSLSPLFFEQHRYEIVIEPVNEHKIGFWHENYNVRKNVTPVGRNGNLLSGVVNFGNDIGLSDLVFLVDDKEYLKLTIEVFPSKISYKEDYKAIVADVTNEMYSLIFDFLKKTYEAFDISSNQQSSPVEFFAIIRKIFGKFISASDMVLAKPHHLLAAEHVVLPQNKIKRVDGRTERWIEKHPDHALLIGNEIKVAKALAVKKYVTYDTNENRLTKYMLQSTALRLDRFKRLYMRLKRDADDAVISEIDSMIRNIQRRLDTGFFREVSAVPANSGMSLVFSMAPGYRELYRCFLLLQHGLSATGRIFNISVKDLSLLYEYWCFIKLNSLMKTRYRLVSQDIVHVTGNGLFVSLVKGKESRVEYVNTENGERIVLSYNPKEINGPTVAQKPDNVLSLEKSGAKNKYKYVFDAKYKIDEALEGSDYKLKYAAPGPCEDDINTMHRYRDAIVSQEGSIPYERSMFGAYVLFPYGNGAEYKNHHFYESIEKVNIGGLPFLPSETELVGKMLDELISDSSESAFERATLPVGIERKLKKVDWSKRDVLIGTLSTFEQYCYCQENNCFLIKASQLRKEELPLHYVAMYKTAKIYGENAGIFSYGEILSITTVTSRDIIVLKLSENQDEEYYKLEVSSWNKLSHPILPREYGFEHAFTNLFLLTHSQFIQELLLSSEAEYRFYSELKRRAGIVKFDTSSGFVFEKTKVLFTNEKIALYRDGNELDSCELTTFSKTPNVSFRRLFSSVRKDGNEHGEITYENY